MEKKGKVIQMDDTMKKEKGEVTKVNTTEIPIILRVENLKKQIADLTSNSGVPAFILEPVFKDFYTQVFNLKQQELQQALQQEQSHNVSGIKQ